MNPLRITADNYRSFAELDLTLPTGCIAVLGENGAGKSSIVNAIDLALFGPPSRNLGDYLTEEAFDAELVLQLDFEHRGELYRVRRGYSPKGRGKTTLDFERRSEIFYETVPGEIGAGQIGDASWEPLTRETAAATQELICDTLGLSRETFRASAFLAQGDGAAFTEAQPRERKAILAEVLGLAIWDKLLDRARQDHARIAAASLELTTRIGTAGEDLARQPELERQKAELDKAVDELAGQIAPLESQRTDAAKALTAAREAAAELKGAREVLETREAELARVQDRIDALTQELDASTNLAGQRDLAQKLAERVPDLEQELARAAAAGEARRRVEHLTAETTRIAGEATPLHERAGVLYDKAAALVQANVETCDRCGQDLFDEARQRARDSYNAEADDLQKRADALDEQVLALPLNEAEANLATLSDARSEAVVQEDLARARAAATRVTEIMGRLERLDELKAERELHERSLPEFRTAAAEQRTKVASLSDGQPDAGTFEQTLADVELRLDGSRRELATNQAAVGRVDGELERIAGLAERVAGEKRELDELQAELDVVLLAERAYGRDGIPALILENAAIPQIEVEANRILAELGTSFSVELHTQRELKGGGVAEALDIVVAGETGGTRPYETFSGGERTRLNLALRIALARLLAHRRGAEVRLLVIDEPEFLDEAGVARLAEVLRGLSPDFERIFLISHQPALREAFDEVLTVVKDGERSRVEEAVEAVPA